MLYGVVSQLKFLYVAITRARKNLWIVDGSERCEPMRVSVLPAEMLGGVVFTYSMTSGYLEEE